MKYKYLYLLTISITIFGCGSYSFTGIQTNAKTFQVNRFENNAPQVEPGIELDFQNTLQDLIQNQTSLSLVATGGDLIYEGEITSYQISPTTATSQNTAAQNRLSIGVKVNFYDIKEEGNNFESKSFSFFYDYPGNSQLIGREKTTAHEEIFKRLTQDIINTSLTNWQD